MGAAIAILLGLVALYVVLKLALGLIGIAIAVVLAIMAYFVAKQVIGQGR